MNNICNNLSSEEWKDSQENEFSFWKWQFSIGNIDQVQRNVYYKNIMEDNCDIFFNFFNTFNFDKKTIVDVGSGPYGILHVIDAPCKIATDSLMDNYRQLGYQVDSDNVESMNINIEDLSLLGVQFADVVFCLNAIDHVQNPKKGIEEIFSIMKIGGLFLLMTDMRQEGQTDSCHKLVVNESDILEWVKKFKIIRKAIIPHGAGNPIMQFVGIFQK